MNGYFKKIAFPYVLAGYPVLSIFWTNKTFINKNV